MSTIEEEDLGETLAQRLMIDILDKELGPLPWIKSCLGGEFVYIPAFIGISPEGALCYLNKTGKAGYDWLHNVELKKFLRVVRTDLKATYELCRRR